MASGGVVPVVRAIIVVDPFVFGRVLAHDPVDVAGADRRLAGQRAADERQPLAVLGRVGVVGKQEQRQRVVQLFFRAVVVLLLHDHVGLRDVAHDGAVVVVGITTGVGITSTERLIAEVLGGHLEGVARNAA